jgi:Protein of unknown function (DUF2934)
MLNPQASTPAKAKTLNMPTQPIARVAPASPAMGSENEIKDRAYQLYEGRGREPGGDVQDWIQAEREILSRP